MSVQLPFLIAQDVSQSAAQSIIDRISPNDLLPIIIVSLALITGTLIGVSAVVFGNWRAVQEKKITAALIQDMLDRNMSAAEIQQIMSAYPGGKRSKIVIPDLASFEGAPRKPPKPAKFA